MYDFIMVVSWVPLTFRFMHYSLKSLLGMGYAALGACQLWVNPKLLHTIMMTSSSGNIFRVTRLFVREIHRPPQRSVTRSFDVFFDLHPYKRLSKQPGGWWFETLSWSLWRHCNVILNSWIKIQSMCYRCSLRFHTRRFWLFLSLPISIYNKMMGF